MITSVELSDEVGAIHKLTVDNDKTIEAETVIISTGATAKYLNIPSEQRLRGGGVSACAVCDGFFYKAQQANCSLSIFGRKNENILPIVKKAKISNIFSDYPRFNYYFLN